MNTSHLLDWIRANAVLIGAAVAALLAVLALSALLTRSIRRAGRVKTISGLINVAALMATSVQASGMWKFFGNTMGLPVGFRVVLFGFMEIALLATGLRARANVDEGGDAGVDGVLVWVLALASGLMSSTDASTVREGAMRVLVAVVVALLWTLDLMAAKRAARKAGADRKTSGPVRWRITPERIFVWLRLADASATDVSTVDASRKVVRYLRATDREKRNGWRWPFTAAARADRARMRLAAHALTHSGDPAEVHAALAERMFAEALTRLGIDREESRDGASGRQGVSASESASRMQPSAASRMRIPGASGAGQAALVMPQMRRIRGASAGASGSAFEAQLKADALDLDRASIAESGTPAGLRQLQRELGIGQARATELRDWLASQREQPAVVEHANGHGG